MKFKIHYCDDFLSWQLIIINCAALYMGPFNIYRQGGGGHLFLASCRWEGGLIFGEKV